MDAADGPSLSAQASSDNPSPTIMSASDSLTAFKTASPSNPISKKAVTPVKGPEDGDTCRICRGEGSSDEPLFYPCKCSGSIKFVHQECLMEWLSHSQKKHCELCKTSFRFTKLYDSSMPPHLPTFVFLRKAALHILQALLLWLRALLVAAVWLVWLPWSMRFVWWGLFWIGDGRWTRDFEKLRVGLEADPALRPFTSSHTRNATAPLSVLAQSATALTRTSAVLFNAVGAFLYSPIALAKQIFRFFSASSNSSASSLTIFAVPATNKNTTLLVASSNNGSLLSYVSVLRNLTPNETVNKFVIDILEGLIITLAVVTAVILVFLIREWVVQQQPALNLAGANLAAIAVEDDAPQNAPARPNDLALDIPLPDEEISMEDTERLAQRLRESAASMQAVLDGDYLVAGNIFKSSKDLTRETIAVCDKIIETRKLAVENGELEKVHDCDRKFLVLQAALEHFPAPLRPNIRAADGENQELQLQADGLLSSTANTAGEPSASASSASGSKMSPPHETAEPTSPEGSDPLRISRMSSASMSHGISNELPPDRPLMPERGQSSLATSIQRDLQEPTDLVIASESEEGSTSNESQTAWQHITSADIRDADVEASSNIVENTEHRQDSTPRLKRKQKTDRLSAGFQDQNDAASMYSNPSERADRDNGPARAITSSSAPFEATSTAPNTSSVRSAAFVEDSIADAESSEQPVSSHHPVPRRLYEGDQTIQGDDEAPRDGLSDCDQNVIEDDVGANTNGIAPVERGIWDKLLDWLFDDPLLAAATSAQDQERDRNEEHVVEDIANEAPFVPFIEARPQNRARDHDGEPRNQNADAANDGVQRGGMPLPNDAEAVDDAEDLEGVFELIGMQGPLTGVFQNAVFCAVFIAATVTSAVWFPYLWGKVILLFLANPVQMAIAVPLQAVSGFTNFAIDLSLFGCGTALFWLDFVFRGVLRPIAWLTPAIQTVADSKRFASVIIRVVDSSVARMSAMIFAVGRSSQISNSHLSLSSLVALRVVQNQVNHFWTKAMEILTAMYNFTQKSSSGTVSREFMAQIVQLTVSAATKVANQAAVLFAKCLAAVRSGDLSLTINHSTEPITSDVTLLDWSPTDRLIAVSAGYVFFALVGTLYIRRGTPFSSSQQGRKIERVIAEMLLQSGGVLKVILIISIEMILFPLYCGLLLDVAMLPLFRSTLEARLNFMMSAPWTAAFIHWFLGTCYMFHFALFVSMCRKIFRSGVLYFIRDPDDPTFHPVRDVLDRSVSSQLRKIGFSALVYGALVIVCMGSVVWTVAFCIKDMFPVRWASDSPFLGFPVDLLLYNLFAPLALQFFKPSKTLQRLYESWFQFCANRLQLTEFLFGEGQTQELGVEIKRKSDQRREGRFVRAPASDQVRIPKGHPVFLEVDEDNRRLDGAEDKEEGVHGRSNPNFTKVWIPRRYRLRIVLFATCIWALTAVLGMSATILPLLIGRNILALLLPNAATINDIYAFSIGIFTVAAAGFAAFKLSHVWQDLSHSPLLRCSNFASLANSLGRLSARAFRVLYTYSSLLILVPTLIALLIEFYFIMPLHTYTKISKSSGALDSTDSAKPTTHTVFILQDCTLGLLYLRVFLRLLLWNPNSRPALALHAIVANGWLNPNVRIATRCFILPFTALTLLALAGPSALAYSASSVLPLFLNQLANSTATQPGLNRLINAANALEPTELRVYLIRFSYPLFLFLGAVAWLVLALGRAAGRWKARIKDEVYLIGERLHNFAERRPSPASSRRVPGN